VIDYDLRRPTDLGMLVTVGGPGGTGSSTIAKILARKWQLHRVDAGEIMRTNMSQNISPELLDDFLEDKVIKHPEIDKRIDKFLVRMSYYPDMLIEGKFFAAIATTMGIPCTVKIWITTNLKTRVMRILEREGHLKEGVLKDGVEKDDAEKDDAKKDDAKKSDAIKDDAKITSKSKLFIETRNDLMRRESNDIRRCRNLYRQDLSHPELFNDIVLDTTGLNVPLSIEKLFKAIRKNDNLSLQFPPKYLKY